jgi:cell division protein FtsN
MAKNYAKFVPPKSRSSRKKKWRTEVVVAVFLLCGGAMAFGSFLYFERVQGVVTSEQSGPSVFAKLVALIHHKKATTVDSKLAINKKAVTADSDHPPGVHFDFYNELPNMQMPADEQAGAMNTPQAAPKAASQEPATEPASGEPVVAQAAASVVATPVPVVANATPSPLPVKAIPSVPKSPVAKVAAAKLPARIFNPEEVSDLLAAEHGVQRYVIQLGVFQSEAAANRLREAITSVGFDVAIVKVTEGNRKLYHVQQGPYETAALAKSFQQRLEKRGIISVIQKASV